MAHRHSCLQKDSDHSLVCRRRRLPLFEDLFEDLFESLVEGLVHWFGFALEIGIFRIRESRAGEQFWVERVWCEHIAQAGTTECVHTSVIFDLDVDHTKGGDPDPSCHNSKVALTLRCGAQLGFAAERNEPNCRCTGRYRPHSCYKPTPHGRRVSTGLIRRNGFRPCTSRFLVLPVAHFLVLREAQAIEV